MTALVDGLRAWWRHRNDPPAWLPDPVRWTVQLRNPRTDPAAFVAEVNKTETHDGHGWTIDRVITRNPGSPRSVHVRLYRDDGRYRSRDDGFRGF